MNIELMSPAGNIESFFEAIENGADSVYLGLKKFNARKPAENFTIHNLKKAINFAHQKNKKVYLTLNIDLKSNEIKETVQILELAININIDAILIKDPALIYIINKFYKNKLNIHLSTQNAVSTYLDVQFIKNIGVKRVVLAREMELSEIKKASSIEGIECEIFVEGSMCFSISGRCLMSSWVGGRSGNRGVCTAPCRVIWENQDKKNQYFSMKDLSLINILDDIKNAGVSAIKIEGRLKNALWVGKITNIYRKAIDKSIIKEEIINRYKELKKFSAREIGEGHIYKHDDLTGSNEDWENYKNQNKEKIIKNKNLYDNNEIAINLDDEYIKVSIELFKKNKELAIKIPKKHTKAKLIAFERVIEKLKRDESIKEFDIKIDSKNMNLKLTSSFIQKMIKDILSEVRILIKKEKMLPELSKEILDFIGFKEYSFKRERLLGDYPDKVIIPACQSSLFLKSNFPIKTIVISLNEKIDIITAKKLEEKFNLILSIPPVLYEEEAENMKIYLKKLYENGIKNFEANSYTGISLLNELNYNKNLGIDMPIMNHLAGRFFYDLGYSSVYSTIEGDLSSFKSLALFTQGKIEALVFGKIPLFHSRVDSSFYTNDSIFKDKFNIEIECHKEKSLNLFVAKFPFSLIGEKIKKEKIYFDSLTADLRYFNDPINTLESIFNNKTKDNAFNSFNFYRKLI